MVYRGKSLRDLREGRNIQLRRISEETRIHLWYLSAIEEERFDRFPGVFYFKSFTREYARALGLDPVAVLRDLEPAYVAWFASRNGRELRPTLPPVRSFVARLRGWGTS